MSLGPFLHLHRYFGAKLGQALVRGCLLVFKAARFKDNDSSGDHRTAPVSAITVVLHFYIFKFLFISIFI